jgi:ribose 1,5-bisphosphate isomerase
MSNHPAVKTVVERIHADAIGGAADIAKEVVDAVAKMSADSSARTRDDFRDEVMSAVHDILGVTPSFAPPINALHRILGRMEAAFADGASVSDLKTEIKQGSQNFLVWAENALSKVAQYGAEMVNNGDTVFMYSMSSTVWRILKRAKAAGKYFEVIVTESRPGNEGLWTVKEMLDNNIPVSVSIDANIGELVPKSDIVFVGADAISSHGVSFVKVGTYPTALVAKVHGVPFYVAADTLKFDPTTLLGLPFRGEPIPRDNVLSEEYPEAVKVVGDLFEPVPPSLVTGVITEMGLISPTAAVTVMWEMKLSSWLNELLPAWARGELRSEHT